MDDKDKAMADGDYRQHLEVVIPTGPIVDDDSAIIVGRALMELVARRAPAALGDGLAELHALVSLLHQLQDWLSATVHDALHHGHSWRRILSQLADEPARHQHDVAPPSAVDDMSPTQKPFLASGSS